MNRRFLPILCALSIASALSALALAQAPPPSVPPAPPIPASDLPAIFDESIDVRVVNVEAVVTGKDGNRVHGLAAKDFRLIVDGKPVPVEYFTEVFEGEATSPAAGEAPATATAGAAEPKPQSVATGAVRTNYLVFIDDYFAVERRRNEVIEALKDSVANLGANDRMAIVAFDGARLTMLSTWSSSPAALQRAFNQALGRPARGLDRISELRGHFSDESFASGATDDGAPLDANFGSPGLNMRQRAYADVLLRQIQSEVDGAVSALRAFAMPEGRKVLLLLDGGYPMSVQNFVSGGTGIPTKEFPEGEEVFRPLTNTANLLGYTIYPIDVPGVEASGADTSSLAGVAGGGLNREQEVEATLHFVAKETGGKPLLNSNRTIAFTTAAADTRSYYWLGFSPAWQRNDKRHTVKVEMVTRGLDVRSRNSFLDLSKKTEVSMMVESALRFGGVPGVAPLPLKVGAVTKGKKGLEIPLTLGIPSEVMTVIPVGNKFAAKLELRIAASDDNGNASDVPVIPLDLTSDHPPQPGRFVKYETKVTLRGKAQELVVAVYDPISGKIASARATVPAPPK
jgi:VWFA-related protein